ncbi:hypothetical protein YC2023_121844 [Brassica napus]
MFREAGERRQMMLIQILSSQARQRIIAYDVCFSRFLKGAAYITLLEQINNQTINQTKIQGTEIKQDIARIQNATDVARLSSIDKDQHTLINIRQQTSIDN